MTSREDMGGKGCEVWEKSETTFATTKTTISSRTSRRTFRSDSKTSKDMPTSLDLWSGRRSQDTAMAAATLSTLGLQQMRGYESLERLDKGPMQWADDEERSTRRGKKPVSTIAFPHSATAAEGEKAGGEVLRPSTLRCDNDTRGDAPARHNSLPDREAPTIAARQGHARHSASISTVNLAHAPAESSGRSSPDANVTVSLDQMSLRQRSIRSLQGIASAWVPGAIRSPYESENETTNAVRLSKGKEKDERKPVRLDRRRLDKAVSLAVEAAQASEQDDKAWKEKRKRLAHRREELMLKQEAREKSDRRTSRFASLPWKSSSPPTKSASLSEGETLTGALIKYGRSSSEEEGEGEDSSQDTKKAGSHFGQDESDNSEESEEEREEDGYSIELYVSSLSYLLAALNPRDVDGVGEKHREEMRRKLKEALHHLETGTDKGDSLSDREEVIRLRVEREVAMLEQSYVQREQQQSSLPSRAHRAAQASSLDRSRKQSIAGYLASSAFDLGLSVGAGALATASRGIASMLPVATADPSGSSDAGSNGERGSAVSAGTTIASKHCDVPGSGMTDENRALITRSQWELTRTLAHSVASTLYSNLAATAEQQRQHPVIGGEQEIMLYNGSLAATSATKSDELSDQLLITAATLARNVKRSPLPSQVRALTKQILSLACALDERYSLSKRSVDVALRKTGQALYYVRKNDLHVKALRTVWAVVEASIAAVEAYRDEEEWKGETQMSAKTEAHRPAIAAGRAKGPVE